MASPPRVVFRANAADLVLGLSRERLIALSRLVLAAGALVAIYLDPSQPTQGDFGYAILGAYLLFASLATVVAWNWAYSPKWNLASHLVDVALICLIVISTEGPTSPYFVLFNYVLFAGTLRWEWRGAIGTGTVLSAVLIVLVAAGVLLGTTDRAELDRLIMRVIYLLVASILFGYVGAYLSRSRERLVSLAVWPGPSLVTADEPDLSRSLAHAAAVIGAARAVAVWDREDEPFRYVVHWRAGHAAPSRHSPDTFGALVAPDLQEVAFIFETRSGRLIRPGEIQSRPDSVNSDLLQTYAVTDVVTAPFAGSVCRGRVFFLDTLYRNEAHIRLAEVIAYRLALELDHHALQVQLHQAARADERVRLARDVHDGTLQCLTAVGLQLKAISNRTDESTRTRLAELQHLLSDEQERIRAFVDATRPRAPTETESFALRPELEALLEQNRRLWNCDFKLSVDPAHAAVSNVRGRELQLLLSEAVANAVRHGGASRVEVSVKLSADQLSLTVRNDGRGLEGVSGNFDHEQLAAHDIGPASLRARVVALHGSMTLSSGRENLEVNVILPLHEPAS